MNSKRKAVVAAFLFALSACVSNEPVGHPTPLDGKWLGSYQSENKAGPVGRTCADGYGGLVITNGIVSGEASNPYGASYRVSGRVADETHLQANFIYQRRTVGRLYGQLEGDHLEGRFEGIGNCLGSWTAIRQ